MSGVISRVTIVITHIRGLITPFITTHEPPSRVPGLRVWHLSSCAVTWSLRACRE